MLSLLPKNKFLITLLFLNLEFCTVEVTVLRAYNVSIKDFAKGISLLYLYNSNEVFSIIPAS